MSTVVSHVSIGFHGKLPGLGDFVQRRLPPTFVEPWDRAFRAALDGVARRVGDGWRERCLEAPAWRFALAPCACGPLAWIGAMVASTDRVGRVFPLVVAAPVAAGVNGWPLIPASTWFDQVDAVLRQGREDGALPDFDQAVCALPDPASLDAAAFVPPHGCSHGLWWRDADPGRGVLLRGLPGEIDYLHFIDGVDAGNHEESA